jgi:hypothetical protein
MLTPSFPFSRATPERLSEHFVECRCSKDTFRPTQQRVGVCGFDLVAGALGQIAKTQRQLPQQHLRLSLSDTPLHTLFNALLEALLEALLKALFQSLRNESLGESGHACNLLRVALAVDDAFILVQRRVDVDEIQVLELPLGIRLQIRQPAHKAGI